MTARNATHDAVAVCIHVGRDECVRKTRELVGLWRVHVEDAKADAGIGEVPADSKLHGGKTLVGEEVSTSDDREDINSGRKTADGVDVGEAEGRAGAGGDGGLEENRLMIRRREAVASGSRWWCRCGRRDNRVRVEEVDASVADERRLTNADGEDSQMNKAIRAPFIESVEKACVDGSQNVRKSAFDVVGGVERGCIDESEAQRVLVVYDVEASCSHKLRRSCTSLDELCDSRELFGGR